MLSDGLHNKVDIKKMSRPQSNRKDVVNQVNEEDPSFKNIPCRIVRYEKVIFDQDITLQAGDLIIDLDTQEEFQVKNRKKVHGLQKLHHTAYEIERKRV